MWCLTHIRMITVTYLSLATILKPLNNLFPSHHVMRFKRHGQNCQYLGWGGLHKNEHLHATIYSIMCWLLYL